MAAELIFENTALEVVDRNGQAWLRMNQIAAALYGVEPKGCDDLAASFASAMSAIKKLYKRHADEFTSDMTAVIRVPSAGGLQETRIFSLRGTHLLAMFARSDRAKQFRRWLLDLIESHIENQPLPSAHPQPYTYATGNPAHAADQLVSADRIFRGMLRSARSTGLSLPQALRRANQAALVRTGLDMLAELDLPEPPPEPAQQILQQIQHLDPGGVKAFAAEWLAGRLPVPVLPCLSMDLYAAYRLWCSNQVYSPLNSFQMLNRINTQTGIHRARARYTDASGSVKIASLTFPQVCEQPPGINQTQWLTPFVREFAKALAAWSTAKP